MNKEVYASKNSDDWKTPVFIYLQAMQKGYFDPCPFKANFNGLLISWPNKVFVNPPYSKLRQWVLKCIEESIKGKKVLLLIPARTDTKAFRAIFEYGANIKFVIGRLRFNETKAAPFPSMLVELTGKKTICEIVERENIRI